MEVEESFDSKITSFDLDSDVFVAFEDDVVISALSKKLSDCGEGYGGSCSVVVRSSWICGSGVVKLSGKGVDLVGVLNRCCLLG